MSSSSYKIVIVIKNFINPKGHQNPINGSEAMAILLKWQILPIDGASAVEGLLSTGLPHLVYQNDQYRIAYHILQRPSFHHRITRYTSLKSGS